MIGPGGCCPRPGGATGLEGTPNAAPGTAAGGAAARSTPSRKASPLGEPRGTARRGGKERAVRKAQPEGQQMSGKGAGA